jgi:hypothetical protein
MNPRKTILNGQEYELVSAEVVEVDFSGKDKEKLYTVICRLLGSFGSQAASNLIQARALDANVKNIPIAGEVVMLVKGPTPYTSYVGAGQEYYYTNPISIQSSVHHNGLPGVTEILPDQSPNNSEKRQSSQDGVPTKTSKSNSTKTTIDPAFPERFDVYPIQPYSGDIILEGRWGQSVRFGSTVDERQEYPVKPYWKKGFGGVGNPITIISNGTNPDPNEKKHNEFTLENPDEDDSSIWMTSGQEVKFTPASKYVPSIADKSVNLYVKNKFGGNQVIIASDRIIFNARKQELIAFSKEGIGLSSEKAISIDGKQVVETESARINLGLNAKSPVLLGDRTMDWLDELCTILSSTLSAITSITVPTGVGPSGTPINTPAFIDLKSRIKGIQQKIEKLQSQLAFVNEFSQGPTEEAKAKEQEREQKQEKRDEGRPEERKSADPNELSISERMPQTGVQWQGNVLWDPNKQIMYGARDKNSTTWFYDKSWADMISDMTDSDSINGFNVASSYEEGKTKFNSEIMDSVVNKDTGSLSDELPKTDPAED